MRVYSGGGKKVPITAAAERRRGSNPSAEWRREGRAERGLELGYLASAHLIWPTEAPVSTQGTGTSGCCDGGRVCWRETEKKMERRRNRQRKCSCAPRHRRTITVCH